MKIETIRALSVQDSERIDCQYDCGKQAELNVTYRMANRELCFYYYCHPCWKFNKAAKVVKAQIYSLEKMADELSPIINALPYQESSSASYILDRYDLAKKHLMDFVERLEAK